MANMACHNGCQNLSGCRRNSSRGIIHVSLDRWSWAVGVLGTRQASQYLVPGRSLQLFSCTQMWVIFGCKPSTACREHHTPLQVFLSPTFFSARIDKCFGSMNAHVDLRVCCLCSLLATIEKRGGGEVCISEQVWVKALICCVRLSRWNFSPKICVSIKMF